MYKFAILGAGLISASHAEALASLAEAELVAVCDIAKGKADEFATQFHCKSYTDVREMLETEPIDVVTICLPTFLHADYVELCASYKKNILCEKPIEMTVEAAERIFKAVKENGVNFMVAQVVRFWTGYDKIKEMYAAGEIGDVYMAYLSRCSCLPFWGNWLIDPKLGAGAIQDMHVHDVDYLQYLFGKPTKVFCHAAKDFTGCFDHAMSSITYASGPKAVVEAAFTMRNSYPFSMLLKICGTKATVELEYRAGVNIGDRSAPVSNLKIYYDDREPIIIVPEPFDPYAKEIQHFIDCLDAGIEPLKVPYQDNMDVIKTICAIRKSAETQEIISID